MNIIFTFLFTISNFFSSLFGHNTPPVIVIDHISVIASSTPEILDRVYTPGEIYIKDGIYVNKKFGFQIPLGSFNVSSTTMLEKIFVDEKYPENAKGVVFINKQELPDSKDGLITIDEMGKDIPVTTLDSIKKDPNYRNVEWFSDSFIDGQRMIEGTPSPGDRFAIIIYKNKKYNISGDLLIGYGRPRLNAFKFIP